MVRKPAIVLVVLAVLLSLLASTGPAAEPPLPMPPPEDDEATGFRIPGVHESRGSTSGLPGAPGDAVPGLEGSLDEARIDVAASGALRFRGER